MPIENLEQFIREIQNMAPETERFVSTVMGAGVESAGDVFNTISPVKSGAYRASHRVATGASAPTQTIYNAPDAPDPNNLPGGNVEIFGSISPTEARTAAQSQSPFQRFWWFNPVPYASTLEPIHLIYEQARLAAEVGMERAIRSFDFRLDGSRSSQRPAA